MLVLGTGLAAGCDEGEGSQGTDWSGEAGEVRVPLAGDGPALAPFSRWRPISVDLEGLVTPRWSPDGRWLLARGTKGVGLFVLSPVDGTLLHAEDGYRGDAVFTPDGDVCRGPRLGARRLRLDPDTGQGLSTDAACTFETRDERLGTLLHSGPDGAVYHEAYLGTITRVDVDGAERLIESRGAWNVAVSPDGRRIAWCLGTLSDPALLVHERDVGVRDLGRGAHPAWSPDGRVLVYASPSVIGLPQGGHTYESDLFAYDADRDEISRLTATPGVAELQPAFAPDGRSLALADWEGDVVFVAPFTPPGRGGDGGTP